MKRSCVVEMLDALEGAKVTFVAKPWGHEIMIDATHFIVKLITVDEGKRTSLQLHRVKDEVVIPIDGSGYVQSSGRATCTPYVVRNRPESVHRTFGPLTMIEVTTPENDDIVRLEDDYIR